MVNATTRAEVLRVMGESETGSSLHAPIDGLLGPVSRALEGACGILLEKVERTYTVPRPKRNQRLIRLPTCPIDILQPFTLTQALDRDFAAADAMDAERYFVDSALGLVHLDPRWRGLHGTPGSVRVTFTGGLGADVDEVAAADPVLSEAAARWVMEVLRRKSSAEKVTESRRGQGVTYSTPTLEAPPKSVLALLRTSPHYRGRRFLG